VSSITVLALAGAAVFGLPMASGASHAAKPVIDVWTGSQDLGDSFVYTHYEYRTTVKFDGTATVTGTIQLIDEFDYAGTHFSCNTGVLPWTATKVG
jgi:hypothetical protein